MSLVNSYEHGQFCWVDLIARNMESAEKFYGQLFGWKTVEEESGPPYGSFLQDGKRVAGVAQMNPDMLEQGLTSMWKSYVNVDDIEAVTERAEQLGAKIDVPVRKVLDAGWLSFIEDPSGGHLGLWQKDQHFGAELINEPNAICWNELSTFDVQRARTFYEQLFGWQMSERFTEDGKSKYYVIQVNGRYNGGIIELKEEDGLPPYWAVYFAVADADQIARHTRQLEGKVTVPPFDTPWGRIAVLSDPQGGVFSIIRMSDEDDLSETTGQRH